VVFRPQSCCCGLVVGLPPLLSFSGAPPDPNDNDNDDDIDNKDDNNDNNDNKDDDDSNNNNGNDDNGKNSNDNDNDNDDNSNRSCRGSIPPAAVAARSIVVLQLPSSQLNTTINKHGGQMDWEDGSK
jgi:hypothetical protein